MSSMYAESHIVEAIYLPIISHFGKISGLYFVDDMLFKTDGRISCLEEKKHHLGFHRPHVRPHDLLPCIKLNFNKTVVMNPKMAIPGYVLSPSFYDCQESSHQKLKLVKQVNTLTFTKEFFLNYQFPILHVSQIHY